MLRIIGSLCFMTVFLYTSIAPDARAATDADFRKQIAADTSAFLIARDGLKRATDFARSRPDRFNPGKERKKDLFGVNMGSGFQVDKMNRMWRSGSCDISHSDDFLDLTGTWG